MATRWGICGAGKISNDFCCILSLLPADEHQIVAIAARDLGKAKDFARIHNVGKAYGSYQELADDPDVDVVFVGVVSQFHYRVSLMMLHSGKNLVCEEPMSLTIEEAKDVLQLVKDKDVFFMEGGCGGCSPAYEQIRKDVSGGALGEILMVQASFGLCDAPPGQPVPNNLQVGALVNLGWHCILLACVVFDEMPETIIAQAKLRKEGIDESGCIILKYKRGGLASIIFSMAFLNITSEITGTKGSIKMSPSYLCPQELVTPTGTYTYDYPTGPTPAPLNFPTSPVLANEAKWVRKCIKEGRKECPQMPHRYSEMVISILTECRRQIGHMDNK